MNGIWTRDQARAHMRNWLLYILKGILRALLSRANQAVWLKTPKVKVRPWSLLSESAQTELLALFKQLRTTITVLTTDYKPSKKETSDA